MSHSAQITPASIELASGEMPRFILEAKLLQAHALAESLCGEGGESFRMLRSDLQDSLLWLLADTLKTALVAFERA